MRDVGFKKEITTGCYFDPFNGFQERKVLLNCVMMNHRRGMPHFTLSRPSAQRPDLNFYLEQSPESLCPFCSDLFEKTTPNFMPNIIPEGKFRRGEACLFPNAFPYDQNNNVAIYRHDISSGWINLQRIRCATALPSAATIFTVPPN